MSDDRSTFEVTRARLEDIVTQVRRKDVSLEQSLDLLEEAVRLVNQCNDLIDQTSFRPAPAEPEPAAEAEAEPVSEPAPGPERGVPATGYEPGADDAVLGEMAAEAEADADAEAEAPLEDEAGEDVSGDPVVVDTFVELSEIEFVLEDDERE